MDPPVVYIETEPFIIMILASIETFKRECLGYIFGHKPTKNRNSYIITNATAIQLAKKRNNSSIEQSLTSELKMKDCFKKYPSIFKVLGDFHSHPEWGSHRRQPLLSEVDIKDMLRTGYPLAFVIKISSINKDRTLWQAMPEGGVRGSLDKYKFYINVFRIVKNEESDWEGELLSIQAPAAIKSLNRALGYH